MQVDISNPSLYKDCRKKRYTIHVAMPPVGTIVINRLEQPQAFQKMNRGYIGVG